jgi:hypothetical protein
MVRGLGFEEFFDGDGRLYTPASTPQWERLRHVELTEAAGINGGMNVAQAILPRYGSELHIETSRHFSFRDLRPARIVCAPPELLERFIGLAKASDRQIQKFAKKYGGLEVFLRAAAVSRSLCILNTAKLALLCQSYGDHVENRLTYTSWRVGAHRRVARHRSNPRGRELRRRRNTLSSPETRLWKQPSGVRMPPTLGFLDAHL